MESITVSRFRAKMLHFLKKIRQGEVINLTSRGRVVARIIPPPEKAKDARKKLSEIGKNAVIHDVISPIDEQWSAEE